MIIKSNVKELVHKNYKIASKLVFLTLWLDIVEVFFSYSSWVSANAWVFVALGFVFTAFTAYVIRSGVSWIKYILLILILLGVAGIALSINDSSVSLVTLGITVLEIILLILAAVLLFRIPAATHEESLDSDI